jgi:hypothetical protein
MSGEVRDFDLPQKMGRYLLKMRNSEIASSV